MTAASRDTFPCRDWKWRCATTTASAPSAATTICACAVDGGADMVDDLSRWNRAGLSRFRYLNGNAATYLEQLRAQMQQRFPRWPSMQSTLKPDATERDWQAQLERQYHSDPNDLIWQINRTFARACHVL